MRWMAMLLLALLVPAACEVRAPAAPRATVRSVVSLSPAITSTLVELGLAGLVRGRTPWCVGVPSAAVVGSLEDVDLERIGAIDPDLILVQRTGQGVPDSILRLADRRGWRVELVPCDSLEDMSRMGATLGNLCGAAGRHDELAARWRGLLARPARLQAGEKVVFVLPGEPSRAFGAGSYLADLWLAWGGEVWPSAKGWPEVQMEDLVSARPDRVFVVGGEPSERFVQVLGERGLRVETLASPAFLRPGPDFLSAAEAWRASQERGP